jgi:hypothetical protein
VRAVDKPLTKDELIKDYGDVFKGLGKLPKAHHIQLLNSATKHYGTIYLR